MPKIRDPRLSDTMAQRDAGVVGHAVTVTRYTSPMSPLIFRDPAIMLAIALAKGGL